MTSPTRWRLWISLVIGYLVGSVGLVWSLARLFVDRSDEADGIPNVTGLWAYWFSFAALWMLLSVIAWLLHTTPTEAVRLRAASSVTLIVAIALAVRLAIMMTSNPQLSDDIWRYVHDGHSLAIENRNPYAASPQELQSPLPINHPQLATIYQPTSQWIFAGCALVASAMQPKLNMHPLTVFRLCFLFFDLWIVFLLILKLKREQRSPWWATLYAWHPLAISEVASSSHQDVIGIAFLLTALTIVDHFGCVGEGRCRWYITKALAGGAAFALTVAVKPLVAPLALPIAWSLRHHARLLFLTGIMTAVVLAALYVPFAFMDGGIGRMAATVETFMTTWAFNGSLHFIVRIIIGSKLTADVLMGLLALVVLSVATFQRRNPWDISGLYLLAVLLLSSTVHPWYLLWALSFVATHFRSTIWVYSLTISWSYAVLGSFPSYHLPIWVGVIEYLPVYGLLGWELIDWCKHRCNR